MNTKLLILPGLCLGGAALLLAPARNAAAWNPLGGTLGESQRDVRVFDNFADGAANNNVTPASQYPGWLGAEQAIWKGIVEWGSTLHGDGSGDINGNTLGSGGANFDAMWAGVATGAGTSNHNIISAIASCGGGTLAFMQGPISDGWTIKFCDNWVWDDGPGTISNRFDLQGVAAHEYGHALGLDHTNISGATMFPSGSAGSTILRSLHSDDIAGVQGVYGVASGTKPVIVATVANVGANTLTIYGSQFGATGNEVWFTSEAATATTVDPIVRVTGVNSTDSGTVITVTMPAAAGPGDVMVNKSGSGGNTLSNAFPTDLVGSFGTPPPPPFDLTGVTPSNIEALIPGTGETITLTGTSLNLVTIVTLDGDAIPTSRWTLVNPTTITLDMPQASSLGSHDLGVSDGLGVDEFPVTIVAPATPKLEWGNGNPGNVVDQDAGLTMTLAGTPGQRHVVLSSNASVPTLGRVSRFSALGSEGPTLLHPGLYVIPAAGWVTVTIGNLPDPALVGSSWFAQSYAIVLPQPFADSNDQSITLVP